MTVEWHYSRGGSQHGPVSTADLEALVKSGGLSPADLLWKHGMAGWAPAGQVGGLFPALPAGKMPPPLPTETPSPMSGVRRFFAPLWANKPLFFALCLAVSVFLTCVPPVLSVAEAAKSGEGPSATSQMITLMFTLVDLGLFVALIVSGMMWLIRSSNRDDRRDMLQGDSFSGNKKWEPVGGGGATLLFFADGGFLRSDGFGAKFQFDPDTDEITFKVPGFGPSIRIQVLSVTADELVLLADGQSLHYQKGESITGGRQAESRAKQKEFMAAAAGAIGTGVVAVGAAALGVLVLGAAVAGAAVAVSGSAGAAGGGPRGIGGGPRRHGPLETHCEECQSALAVGAKRCPYCGSTEIWSM